MEVPNRVFDPFTNPMDAEVYLQEELINLQSNDELKLRLKHGILDCTLWYFATSVSVDDFQPDFTNLHTLITSDHICDYEERIHKRSNK
uniref:Uncharacterized protein n=1 Tax=Trichuris muris TaxID=70415 RepID=A0A5S6QL57_TRIMR